MADIRLHGTENQRCVSRAPFGQYGAQRRGFDRVAERGARAVGFDEMHLAGAYAGPLVGIPEDCLLGEGIGSRKSIAEAVVVRRAARDEAPDVVPVGQRAGEPLEDHDPAALATAVAVGAGVEGLAAAVRGQPAELAERRPRTRADQEVHPARQGRGRLSGPQALAGEVQGVERGGTGGVDGDARFAQAQDIGETIRHHVERTAGGGVRHDAVQRRRGELGVVVPDHSGEHPGTAARQRVIRHARVSQGFPGDFQKEALLRVHFRRLARGYPEEQWIEFIETAAKISRPVGHHFRRGGRVGVHEIGGVPATGRDGADGVRAGKQQLPEFRRIVRHWESAGHGRECGERRVGPQQCHRHASAEGLGEFRGQRGGPQRVDVVACERLVITNALGWTFEQYG